MNPYQPIDHKTTKFYCLEVGSNLFSNVVFLINLITLICTILFSTTDQLEYFSFKKFIILLNLILIPYDIFANSISLELSENSSPDTDSPPPPPCMFPMLTLKFALRILLIPTYFYLTTNTNNYDTIWIKITYILNIIQYFMAITFIYIPLLLRTCPKCKIRLTPSAYTFTRIDPPDDL